MSDETDDVLELKRQVTDRLRRRRGWTIAAAIIVVVVVVLIGINAVGIWLVERQGDRAACVDELEAGYEVAVGAAIVAAVERDASALAEAAAAVDAAALKLQRQDRHC